MLLNQKNQIVKIHPRFTSEQHPAIFAPLREVKQPDNHSCGDMFRMGTRAKFKE